MYWTALFLSRLQFASTISFHIVFPSFSIGIAAWLAILEWRYLVTHKLVYRRLFELWLKVFGIAFGMGVVSGVVMAFQLGTNWSRLSAASGPIQGPLLTYESFTAFALEASFFGVLLFGRGKVSERFYFFSSLMVPLGTMFSAFWIMTNNSWMQAPVGYVYQNGYFTPTDWGKILFSPVLWVRFPHMLLASFLTGAMCVAATGAWYRLRGMYQVEAVAMLRMGLGLAAILIPIQLLFGHLNGDYVHERQPVKFAAIEARWHDEQPASEVLVAWPDAKNEVNLAEWKVPYLGSLIATGHLDSKEVGLTDFPRENRPPVAIVFWTFRIMVACGLLMLAISWLGSFLMLRDRLQRFRVLLWTTFFSFPLPFVATLTGWFTAEVGRQPWIVYGVLRTADAVTPSLTVHEALSSLVIFCFVYTSIFGFGITFIYRLLRAGPVEQAEHGPANPKRPLALGSAEDTQSAEQSGLLP
jgi:cytochrome d ubiquinol oxidase subunit I